MKYQTPSIFQSFDFFRPSLLAALTLPLLTLSAGAATLALDNFSTGDLMGGNGWTNHWSGGVVSNGQLVHRGDNPQQITRNFTLPPLNTSGLPGSTAGFFSLKADLAFSYSPGTPTQAYGVRMFQDSSNDGTFVGIWRSDVNGGQLSFLTSGGQTVIVPGSTWNISSTTTGNFSYTIVYDVTVLRGQNSNQLNGTYKAQIIRSDGQTYTTGDLAWIRSNLDANNINKIGFYNNSNQTTVRWDNITVATTSQMIPEASPALMVMLGSGLVLLRRHRSSRR